MDKVKDDIPMQREACREFAQRMGWTVGKEFLEKGVSGFKVSVTDRDAIQELKAAALRNEFQILLVFMFDRIGRIDDETPFVVEWFVKHGIRVWSVQEGEQRFESHVDKLMNYIRFWQASGESEKTSMRIKTRMQQLTAEGSYTGGGVPFGYQLEKRGRLNKRGKEIYDLVINPVEAEWVVEIFEKTVKYGYGSHRLATYLNENGVRTHSGAKFQCNTIIRILRNKLTCGYMVSGDTVSPHMKELQIIDEKMFERAQYILEQRAMKHSDERQIALSTKSQAMLSGVMFCAHCGGRMTSNMHTEKYTVKSTGEVKEKHYLRYICYHRSRKLCDCDGQSVYSAEKVDKAVIEVVASIFSKISDAPDEAELRKEYNKEMQKCRAKQTKLCTELKKYQKQYDIGMNDDGEVVGVEKSKKLLEDIPNKIVNALGIVADVNLHNKDGKDYIEIIVSANPYPVSYHGEYHYRSGSTKQQLVGPALNQFLLKKTGITWDSVPIDGIKPEDFRHDSFDIFREQAERSQRMDSKALSVDNPQLLDNLNLLRSARKKL